VVATSADADDLIERSLESLLALGLPEDTKLTARIRPLARELLIQLDPQDAAERMLAVQMIAAFTRSMFLSRNANHQKHPKWFKLYSGDCDRAMTLFRRQMQTFTDLRRLRRTTFNAIRQANIAAQQIVVTDCPTPDSHAQPLQTKKNENIASANPAAPPCAPIAKRPAPAHIAPAPARPKPTS
jgi:hypothetical protein